MDQVELDVPAAAPQLPQAFGLAERECGSPLDDRQVSLDERAPQLLDHREHLLDRLPFGSEVIEEDAANAAGLVPVREPEVLVAPRLEAVVIADRLVVVAGVREGLVEVNGVVPEKVVRREVGPAAEPDRVALLDAAKVRVRRRHHRRLRMKHERHAGRPKRAPRARHVR